MNTILKKRRLTCAILALVMLFSLALPYIATAESHMHRLERYRKEKRMHEGILVALTLATTVLVGLVPPVGLVALVATFGLTVHWGLKFDKQVESIPWTDEQADRFIKLREKEYDEKVEKWQKRSDRSEKRKKIIKQYYEAARHGDVKKMKELSKELKNVK